MANAMDDGGGGGGIRSGGPIPSWQLKLLRSANAPMRRVPSAPNHAPAVSRRINGGGGGNTAPRYTSGKNIGSNSTGRISPVAPPAPPAPKKPPMSIEQWLAGDTAYKQQTAAQTKGLADYQTQMGAQEANYRTDYTRNDLNQDDQYKVNKQSMADDYASRGMSESGLAVKSYADLATEYQKQQSALSTGQAQYLANNQTGLANYKSTQNIDAQRYKNEAVQRRAAKLGL